MGLQTAPSTITFTKTVADDSTMTLMKVIDNLIGYVVNNVGGINYAALKNKPVLTLAYRPATKQSGAAKYTLKCVHTTYDALEKPLASALMNVELVLPELYGDNPELLIDSVVAFVRSDEFLAAVADKTFFR